MTAAMIDVNAAALCANEAQEDARQRWYDYADADRARLVAEGFDSMTMNNFADVLAEFGPEELDAIKRLVRATAKDRNLSRTADAIECLSAAVAAASAIRGTFELLRGEDLVNDEADRLEGLSIERAA